MGHPSRVGSLPTPTPFVFPTKNAPLGPRGAITGLVLMLVATVAFCGMTACVKSLREHGMSTIEVIFYRMAPSLPWLAWEIHRLHLRIWPRRPALVLARSAFGGAAMATNFAAVRSLSLVQHTSLHLLQPVMVALCAPLLLREKLRGSALWALAVGLLGALVLVRADRLFRDTHDALIPALPAVISASSALFSAFAHITIRLTTARIEHDRAPWIRGLLGKRHEPEAPESVVFHFTLHVSIVAFVCGFALGDFRQLPVGMTSVGAIATIGLMALCGAIGQLTMSRAYAHSQAPAVAMVSYAGLPVGLVLDLLLWRSIPSATSIVGAVLVFAAGLLLVRGYRTGS